MKTRVGPAALAILVVALPALSVAVPSASADPRSAGESKTVAIRTKYGATYFYNYGDQLHVSDYDADGRGVRGYAFVNNTRYTVYTNAGLNSSDDKYLHLKEGTAVYIQLCYTKKGKNVKCSGTVKGYA